MKKTVSKIWGMELIITNTEKYCGKILFVTKDKSCSLHFHKLKDETFYILKGLVLMEVGEDIWEMESGKIVHIPTGMKHRFAGIQNSEILEISTQHFDDDSYRLTESGDISISYIKNL